MSIRSKYLFFFINTLFIPTIAGVLFVFLPFFSSKAQKIENISIAPEELTIVQENSLAQISSPINPEPEAVQKLAVVITAYSSTVWQTDDTPHITAAGTNVREGIIANNYFPFGTKIRIPELYGNKIFVVEDRMSWKKGNYQFDIWFPDYLQALNFGAKRTYIEILES